jgi:hypothetical protein
MRRLTIGCVLLIGRVALAQAQGSGEVATTTTPAETAAAAPAEVTALPPPEVAPPPRKFQIRAGADGAPAVFAPGVSYGANFSGRIGVQIKNRWGVYADVGGGFGFGGSISAGTGGGGVSINVSDYWRLTAMAEADIGRYFFVSFGPGVCGCTWGGVSEVGTAMGASQAAYVASGYFPELLARVGVGFGKTRHKFTLALENMVAFGKMTQVSQNASAAGADQSVRIGNLAVGWTPGIVFGWDMR